MRKRVVLKGIVIAGFIILLSIAGMYLGLARYYAGGFSYQTWINGIYCTGKSVNEVNEELLKQCYYTGLTIIASDGKSYNVPAGQVNLSFDFSEALSLYLERQNPYLWIDNLLRDTSDQEIEPVLRYDTQAFEQLIDSFSLFDQRTNAQRRLEITKGEAGYSLLDERRHVLNEAKTREAIKNAFEAAEPFLDLEESGCYEDLELTDRMERDIALWDKLKVYQECGIVYQFGEIFWDCHCMGRG